MPIRITGMNSGLDTDTIIQELVKAKSEKLNTLKKEQTKLSWTQDVWKTTNSKIYSFYNKSLSNFRFQSTFNKKATTTSNSNVATVIAGDSAVNGSQSLIVKQLARSGYLTGGKLSEDKSIKSSTKLSELDEAFSGTGIIDVKVGNKTTSISVDGDTTISGFVDKLTGAGLNASFDATNQRLFVSVKDSGASNDFSLTAADSNGLTALSSLGLVTSNDITNNAEYQTFASYYDAVDNNIVATLQSNGTIASTAASRAKALQAAIAAEQKSITGYQKSLTTAQEAVDKAKDNETYKGIEGSTREEKQATVTAQLEDVQNRLTASTEKLEYIALSEKDPSSLTEEEQTRLTELQGKYGDASMLDKEALLAEQETLKTELADTKKSMDAVKAVATAEQNVTNLQDSIYNSYKTIQDNTLILNEYYATLPTSEDITKNIEANTAAMAEASEYAASIGKDPLPGTGSYNLIEDTTNDLVAKVKTAHEIVNNADSYTTGSAVRIMGQDSIIELNGAEFTSNTNTFSVNDLTITAKQVSAISSYNTVTAEDGSELKIPIYEETSINTDDDVSGIYDMVVSFFDEYNSLIKELDTLYGADSAKGYEPLTDEEKEAMTDDEIEKWEKKIKDALLRQDSDLGSVISTVKSAMMSNISIGGTTYNLSSFGIETLGYFGAEENERGMYHIDGNAKDSTTSGEKDILKSMIASDPDTVSSFFTQLSTGMYDKLSTMMRTTQYSSIYTVYEDKKMKTDYESYTSKINDAQEKLTDYEDKYYKQFSAMETALAKINSQSSSITSILGGGA